MSSSALDQKQDNFKQTFDGMSIIELCAVCETTPELQESAGIYFQRKYSGHMNEGITIREENGTVGFDETDCYASLSKYFGKVQIKSGYHKQLVQFMNENCGENIKIIEFTGGIWSKWFLDEIKRFLRNVEALKIEFQHDGSISLDDILFCCPRCRHLKLFDNWVAQTVELPFDRYPSLKTLEYDIGALDGQADLNSLAIFFEKNRQVKRFICNKICGIDIIKKILTVLFDHSKIEELFLCGYSVNFALALRELKLLDDREKFRRLEIQIHCLFEPFEMNLFGLAPLKKLSGIYFNCRSRSRDFEGVIMKTAFEFKIEPGIVAKAPFVNLKVLQFNGQISIKETVAIGLAQNLLNLEKICLDVATLDSSVVKLIKPFVQFSKKVSEIIVSSCRDEEDVDRFVKKLLDLRTIRKGLGEACQVTIYLDEQLGISSSALLDVAYASTDLFDIKRTPLNYFYDKWSQADPFISFSLK